MDSKITMSVTSDNFKTFYLQTFIAYLEEKIN
jgi:hypothetical protein